jgi:hypothetical protein
MYDLDYTVAVYMAKNKKIRRFWKIVILGLRRIEKLSLWYENAWKKDV